MVIDHRCTPGNFCGICQHNAKNGGRVNHPRTKSQARATTKRVAPQRVERKVRKGGCGGCGGAKSAPAPVAASVVVSRMEWVPVPPPVVNPTKARLVISLAVGEEGEQTLALTEASQRRYAERVGADYTVIREKTQPWFMLEKFRYKDYIGYYPEGTLCLDADIWVSRHAPDLFALVPPGKIGVSIGHDLHVHGLMPRFNRELEEVCLSQGVAVPKGADRTHWNSGLVVLRPEHADYWSPPSKPVPRHWIAEELWSKVTTFQKGWELHDLPHPAVHWQWWRDQSMSLLNPLPQFVHPAGLTQQEGGLQRRLDLFRVLEASGR